MNYLLIAKGEGNGSFRDPKIITSGLSIEERSDLQIVNVNGDGLPDIVIGSQKLGRVAWFRNRSDCNFDAEQTLAIQHDLSHYAVGDIDADGIKDLVMTLGNMGVLKIINGKQLPFWQNEITMKNISESCEKGRVELVSLHRLNNII